MNLYDQLGAQIFLKDYWEQKHLVLKNFLKAPQKLIETQDLIDMAENEYFESRLVGEKDNNFSVEHGPFKFIKVKNKYSKWTLINHNVNLYSKELMAIQKELEFIPAWLFDDAMTTYSNPGSTVGAHIDNYNVFIIQLVGRRQWEIELTPDKEYKSGLEVKILKSFKPDHSYTLNPGDMIYIPPHVAHQGTSLDESLSLSLGFKSIEDKALVEQFAIELVNNFQSEDFYRTTFDKPVTDPVLIDEQIINDIKERLMKNIFTNQFIENTILKFSSASKRPVQELASTSFSNFVSKAKSEPLYKDEFARISAIKKKDYFLTSINDFEIHATDNEYIFLKSIAYMTCEDEILLSNFPSFEKLIFTLYSKGILFFNDHAQD